MSRRQINRAVLLPLFAGGLLIQSAVPLARIVTTYRALDLGFGVSVVGLLSAVFALLPVFLTVAIGRFYDRGSVAQATLAGAILILLGSTLLWLLPPTLPTLLAATAILGIGQTLGLSSMQLIASTSSSRAHRDSVLGNYMVAISLGQAIGPLFVGLPRDGMLIFLVPVAGSLLLVMAAARLWQVVPPRRGSGSNVMVPLAAIAATRGLPWIVLTGAACVTAQDLLLAFLPVWGEETGVAPALVGGLLSARAMASMLSRVAFGQAVRWFGRMRLMLGATTLSGLGLMALVLPLPVWAVALCLLAAGFGLGIALTSTIAFTLVIAPPTARGTALSLRLTANRIAQFSIPLLAGLVVAPLGAGGIFGLVGAVLLGAAALRPRSLVGLA